MASGRYHVVAHNHAEGMEVFEDSLVEGREVSEDSLVERREVFEDSLAEGMEVLDGHKVALVAHTPRMASRMMMELRMKMVFFL